MTVSTQIRRCGTIAVLLGISLVFISCKKKPSADRENPVELPVHVDTLANLQVFTADEQEFDTVKLVREQVFESNEDVYIRGYTGDVVVDNRNRVFIEGFIPGNAGIYVFGPDGNYITTLGSHGRGPGEFLTLVGLDVRDERLFIYDSHQRKIAYFSLDDFSLAGEIILRNDSLGSELMEFRPDGDNLHVFADGSFLMNFESNRMSNENRAIRYHKISASGIIMQNKLLELQRHRYFEPDYSTPPPKRSVLMPYAMPFSPSTVFVASARDTLYATWTEDFLIKKYDCEGKYVEGIYYNIDRAPLDISALDLSDGLEELIEANREMVPRFWPAIHTLEVDDQDRIWVSTIMESDSLFRWWVLNPHGELQARFQWKGERASRNTGIPPMIYIKNGYLYSRERNLWEGIDRIVKYRIDFKPHPHNRPGQ